MKGTGRALACGLLGGLLGLAGCEGGSDSHLGDGHDFGANDPAVYAAFGDSITYGSGLNDLSERYSDKLAGMLNKTVLNYGFPGAASGEGAGLVNDVLADARPGFLLILFGVNDLIMGYPEETVAVNLRVMIQACWNNKTIPVVATLTPTFRGYEGLASGVQRVNEQIRQLCSELDVARVDLESAFDGNQNYMQYDGLHPNEGGHALMAASFHDVVK